MNAQKLFEEIKQLCIATPRKKSDKQRKLDMYRVIKSRVAFYREQAEESRNAQTDEYKTPTDDYIKIYLLGAVIVWNSITADMNSDEFADYIIKATTSIMTTTY